MRPNANADAQADLHLRWAYMSFCRFCFVPAQIINVFSGDSKDKDVIGCHYLLFAVGPLNPGKTDINYHGPGTTKTASNSTICIEECGT